MRVYPGNDLHLGTIVGSDNRLILSRQDRARHTYMVGATRTGKTKMVEGMIRQDIRLWPNHRCPLVVLDPHGTLHDSVVEYIAAENLRRLPVIPIDLRRNDLVVSYNLLRRREGADAGVIVRGFVQAILHAWGQSNSNETPRLATWLETLLMLAYERECTLAEALELIRNPELRSLISGDVEHLVARTTLQSAGRLKETEFQDRVESTLYRINRFLGSALMRATLCQTGASLDMGKVLEEGSILLVTTSTEGTRIAEEDASAFGSILLTDLWTAARRRGKREEGLLRPCYTFVDEFQIFVSPSIATGLAEASGYGLHLTLAHQFPSQLSDRGDVGKMILNSVLANAKNKICFQLSHPDDLEMLARLLYRQHVDPDLIKHEIYSTKVMDHTLTYMPSYSTGTSQSETNGQQWSDTVGRSKSHTDQWSHSDGVSDSVTIGESFTDGEGHSTTENEGWSEIEGSGWSDQSSSSRGTSRSGGRNSGHSDSESFGLSGDDIDGRSEFDFDRPDGARQSRGRSSSDSIGDSVSWGSSDSESEGSSRSGSMQQGRSGGSSESYGTSSAHTSSISESHAVSSSDSYGEADTVGHSTARTDGGSKASSVGTSIGTTLSPMLLPVMGKELSSRQYTSIDEQLFKFMQFVDGLRDRHCAVRTASGQRTTPLVTATIRKPLTTMKFAGQFTLGALQKLDYVRPMIEALARIAERERTFVAELRGYRSEPFDQPVTAKRASIIPRRRLP